MLRHPEHLGFTSGCLLIFLVCSVLFLFCLLYLIPNVACVSELSIPDCPFGIFECLFSLRIYNKQKILRFKYLRFYHELKSPVYFCRINLISKDTKDLFTDTFYTYERTFCVFNTCFSKQED